MIIRYHLTDGSTLDEEVTFATSVEEVTASLVDTLITQTKTPLGPMLAVTPLIRIRSTVPVEGGSSQTKTVTNLILTSQILRMELVLSDMEQRREAGAEGRN